MTGNRAGENIGAGLKRMSGKKQPKKPSKPRQTWDRNPVQRPHSSPKGKKGNDRKRDKEELRREIERLSESEE